MWCDWGSIHGLDLACQPGCPIFGQAIINGPATSTRGVHIGDPTLVLVSEWVIIHQFVTGAIKVTHPQGWYGEDSCIGHDFLHRLLIDAISAMPNIGCHNIKEPTFSALNNDSTPVESLRGYSMGDMSANLLLD